MPSAANITVKAADGSTDVVFTIKAPSAGDGVKATWYADALGGGSDANKPKLEVWSQNNAARDARRWEAKYSFPYYVTSTVDSTTRVMATIPVNFTITLPTSIPDAQRAEAVAHITNLLKSTLLVDSMKSAFAPT